MRATRQSSANSDDFQTSSADQYESYSVTVSLFLSSNVFRTFCVYCVAVIESCDLAAALKWSLRKYQAPFTSRSMPIRTLSLWFDFWLWLFSHFFTLTFFRLFHSDIFQTFFTLTSFFFTFLLGHFYSDIFHTFLLWLFSQFFTPTSFSLTFFLWHFSDFFYSDIFPDIFTQTFSDFFYSEIFPDIFTQTFFRLFH